VGGFWQRPTTHSESVCHCAVIQGEPSFATCPLTSDSHDPMILVQGCPPAHDRFDRLALPHSGEAGWRGNGCGLEGRRCRAWPLCGAQLPARVELCAGSRGQNRLSSPPNSQTTSNRGLQIWIVGLSPTARILTRRRRTKRIYRKCFLNPDHVPNGLALGIDSVEASLY
jgi:hypothetical protein